MGKKTSLLHKRNLINSNAQKLKKIQKELTQAKKEQLEYIQCQIIKIRYSVEDRQSRLAWQTVNERSGRKGISSAKLKAASQEERRQKWKEHFKNLLGNWPDVTSQEIVISQLNIKHGHLTQYWKNKSRKAAGLQKYFLKYGRQENLTIYSLR